MLNITINGKSLKAGKGQTILEVAKENDIYIPTLCADDRLKPFTSCFVCVVQIEGVNGFKTSCSTEVTDGMVVITESEEIKKSRQAALNLILSNHYGDCIAPCQIKCPAHVDIQGYIAHVANKEYDEAVALIRETNPFPLSTGKICTHPCENECRRDNVEEPVAIKNIKRVAVDNVLKTGGEYKMPVMADKMSGKKVAVIGAGPAGLTCAYFLRTMGHDVKVFDMMEKAGGMLRYGIPEYRLPKVQLDHEISQITKLGIDIEYNKKLGRDIHLEELKKEGYDAVFLGIGAWEGTKLNLEGEDSRDVFIGIDFLRKVIREEKLPSSGTLVALGGGNTAIDVVRTAKRIGFSDVILAYRRTRKEMPADIEEIEQAEEENIQFNFLTAPVKIETDENDKVTGIMMQKMELGEPDKSGRRRPVPIEGSEYVLKADYIVSAIGQKPDPSFVATSEDEMEKSLSVNRWNCFDVNNNYMTTTEGVFAGGDVVLGPAAAIDAIGQGKEAAYAIDNFLGGKYVDPYRNVNVKKEDFGPLDPAMFELYEKNKRTKMRTTDPEKRINMNEVELGYDENEAVNECSRCLECGCHDVFKCDLRRIATEVETNHTIYKGEVSRNKMDTDNPYIRREMDKCILCGKCVRICSEYKGVSALSFAYRGIDAMIEPTLGRTLEESTCINCGLCVEACPTGALVFNSKINKPGPFKLEQIPSTCNLCSTGCQVYHEFTGNTYVSTIARKDQLPNQQDLCKKGYFSINKNLFKPVLSSNHSEIMTVLRNNEIDYEVVLSPALSLEEIHACKKLFGEHYNKKIISLTSGKNDFIRKEDILKSENIILVSNDADKNFPLMYQWTLNDNSDINLVTISDTEDRITEKSTNLTFDELDKFNETADFKNASVIIDADSVNRNSIEVIKEISEKKNFKVSIISSKGNCGINLVFPEITEKTDNSCKTRIVIGKFENHVLKELSKTSSLLRIGGFSLENTGTFINFEGRISRISDISKNSFVNLFSIIKDIAMDEGLTFPGSIEEITTLLEEKHKFLKEKII